MQKIFVNYFSEQKSRVNLFCWNHVKHSLEPTIRKTFDRKIWVKRQVKGRMVIGRVGLRLLQTLIIENIWELWANFLSIKVWANGQYIRKLARIILFYFTSLFLFAEKTNNHLWSWLISELLLFKLRWYLDFYESNRIWWWWLR